MRYVMTFTEGRRGVVLGEDDTAETVSAECRDAVLAFVTGVTGFTGVDRVTGGWDKVDLARWLMGPYARATRHAPRRERVADVTHAPDVTSGQVRELVTRVRDELVDELAERTSRLELELPFVHEAVAAGRVTKAADADGCAVWVPVDRPRLTLAARLRALLAADALDAPDAYRDLYVCGYCGVLAFDVGGKASRLCPGHRRASGFPEYAETTRTWVSGER